MKRPAGAAGRYLVITLVLAVAFLVVACASAPTLAPGQVPLGLHGGGRSSDFADSFGPGVPFAWGVLIENTAGSSVSIDGYELVGRPQGLEVLGAGLLPRGPNPIGFGPIGIGPLAPADSDVQAAVAAHPIVGSSFGSSGDPGWAKGGWLAFVLRAAGAGDYTVSAVRIRYHVAGSSFDTTIPATLEVCAGAAVAPGDTCPYRSPRPS